MDLIFGKFKFIIIAFSHLSSMCLSLPIICIYLSSITSSVCLFIIYISIYLCDYHLHMYNFLFTSYLSLCIYLVYHLFSTYIIIIMHFLPSSLVLSFPLPLPSLLCIFSLNNSSQYYLPLPAHFFEM